MDEEKSIHSREFRDEQNANWNSDIRARVRARPGRLHLRSERGPGGDVGVRSVGRSVGGHGQAFRLRPVDRLEVNNEFDRQDDQHAEALPAVKLQHPLPKDLKDTPALRTSVLLTGCEKASGGWQATGTAKTASGKAADYRVVVFFTDQYSRIVDSASVTVKVPAGKTGTWTAPQKFTPPAGVKCVLRAISAA